MFFPDSVATDFTKVKFDTFTNKVENNQWWITKYMYTAFHTNH